MRPFGAGCTGGVAGAASPMSTSESVEPNRSRSSIRGAESPSLNRSANSENSVSDANSADGSTVIGDDCGDGAAKEPSEPG